MDAYAYLLDHLSADDFRKLRGYAFHSSSKFTTWLVVVARRLCIDYGRTRYGRVRNTESERERIRIQNRRRLDNLVNDLKETDEIPDENGLSADRQLESIELTAELNAAIDSIPPGDQLLLRLRFDDGLSAAEIAVLLHYPSQFQVYRRLNSVLATLRARLRARGIETAAS
jgi:RNA polymerase sigma factor (sigma-70 family)